MIGKKAYEFDLQSGSDQWVFLALKVHGQDEPGWFNLYLFEEEGGDYRFVSSLDENVERAVDAAMDYVASYFEIDRSTIQEIKP